MAITLDANDPTQVASASHLEFDTGVAGQKAVIFSGIAIPSWSLTDDSNIYRQTVTVNLRYTVLAVINATITVGLASIYNGDSAFLFATDAASLAIDNNTQELLLLVDVALTGDPSELNRFGYQVVVVVTTQVTGISGTIRFDKSIFDASGLAPGQEAQLFLISAETHTPIPPPPTGGFGGEQDTPVAYGTITGMSVNGTDFDVAYSIPGAPYNQQLYVTADAGALFTPSGQVFVTQNAGPDPVVLTVAVPGVSGVDFQAVRAYVPK
ncbi:MAG TPA: hypothetical protein VE779_04105 [Candidatus Angelobacter sp.]|nr:hypothetical protein [Candidatus Angelobacter sp.]